MPGGLLFFYADDPRAVQILGYEGDRSVFFEFATNTLYSTTTTDVSTADAQHVVASFAWTAHTHLGSVRIHGGQPAPMSDLVVLGRSSSRRRFLHRQKVYEWHRRPPGDPVTYELLSGTNVRLAAYAAQLIQTPIGLSYGTLTYAFENDELLLECLLALCVNRWIDLHGV